MFSRYHMEQKKIIEASCNNNMHNAEKDFCSCYFWRFESHFFSDRVKKNVVYLVCMALFWISREDKSKWIPFLKRKLVFLYVDNKLDVPKCRFIMKKVVQTAACVYTYICGGHKIICGYNFVALLSSMLSKYRNQSTDFHSIRWQH